MLEAGGSSEAAWDQVTDAAPWLVAISRDAKLEALGRGMARKAGPPDTHAIDRAGNEETANAGLATLMDALSPRWLIGWRDITGIEKIRTTIASVVPRAAIGPNLPLLNCFPELGTLSVHSLAN